MTPKEAPQVWNEKMEEFLELEVPDDTHGVLQDIHWSLGYFGYFPSYTLGNLYSAQFFEQVKKEIPDLVSHIEKGKFWVILNWLRKNIHEKGKYFESKELVKSISGKPLDEEIFITYLKTKFGELYGF
jgi:carboxypeptidase Taq